MKRFFLVALSSLTAIAGLISCKSSHLSGKSKSLSRSMHDMIEANGLFDQYFMGFELYDPEEETIIYAINEHKHFTPASNTKILTLFASLNTIGDSIPAFYFKKRNDSLIIWGSGDPVFLHPDLPQKPETINFLSSFPGPIVFSDQNYFNARFGPGWSWDDYPYYFSTETSSFPIFGNNLTLKTDTLGRFEFIPFSLKDSISFTFNPSGQNLYRHEFKNQFEVRIPSPGNQRQIPLFLNEDLFIYLLSDTLNKSVRHIPIPFDTTSNIFYSIPADSVYRVMMQESDNFLAEQLLLICGGILTDSLSTHAAIENLKHGLFKHHSDELVWRDGSGLSRYNLFTPSTMVVILNDLLKQFPKERLFSIFPSGGESGTIEKWYASTDDKPYIYAKTGTLSNVHCLSGYLITKSNKTYIFSFMHNNYPFGSSETKRAMTPILEFIRDNY